MPIEDRIEKAPSPDAPKVLDLGKCQKLIAAAPRYSRLPTGDFIQDMAEQLQLALADVTGASTKIVNAQNEALRYKRETETANSEVLTANQNLLAAREELAALKSKAQATAVTSAPVEAPKKRGPKAKVVPINPAAEKKVAP